MIFHQTETSFKVTMIFHCGYKHAVSLTNSFPTMELTELIRVKIFSNTVTSYLRKIFNATTLIKG